MSVLVLQTTTFSSHGGIQTFNRVFARALNEFTELGQRRILIGTDSQDDIADIRNRSMYSELNIEAFGRSRSAMVRRVLQLAFTSKIDLMIVGHVNYAALGALVRLIQPSLRYGVVIHGKDVWLRLSAMRRYGLRNADFILSVSRDTEQQANKVNGALKGRTYILPNALEWGAEGFSRNSSIAIPSGTRLLSIGRLADDEREKGIDSVIEALPKIIAQVPDVQYIVIGDGTDLDRHRRLAGTTGVAERVHFIGFVDEITLQSFLRACDIFVLPSAQEGFGIVFLEAMHFRKPIVAARFGGTPEVVLNGMTGMLVNYGDSDEIAQAITSLCVDSGLRKKLGDAGFDRLQNNFTFDHFKQRLSNILKEELPSQAISPQYKAATEQPSTAKTTG